jgi:hypothetical protein
MGAGELKLKLRYRRYDAEQAWWGVGTWKFELELELNSAKVAEEPEINPLPKLCKSDDGGE